ncbi:Crp/Fnr family transcriptional regulator [Hymenobacter amundsenii]|uniref:Crp/Fnr family transcriptional regulator n=1 Tax=Hymenobacter amundsenii TaxID=2006685 RepID=A0A246FM08_9BACT|nr:cyclic nucleotide-binding domain-containing protein [Hymenobacter amundsenii]OWP63771.1 Crp/Fnr family transcriptional regulator [Hymenobacter amundsenii]
MNLTSWYRSLGVRPGELQTVWHFSLHSLLLNGGTMLVYVAATALLLENDPVHTLPLAYVLGALAMLVVGRGYAWCEQHWLLQRLVVRALLAVLVGTLVMAVVVLMGPSVSAAVAIMVGYRLIYLLTYLAFWGTSTALFNLQQSRRLFSLINAGDLPAKALGAIGAVMLQVQGGVFGLLLVAFGLYGLAWHLQRRTFTGPPLRLTARLNPAEPARIAAGIALIRHMGLSILALTVVAVGLEYLFLRLVSRNLLEPARFLHYLSGLLALLYVGGTLLRLGVARYSLSSLGLRRTFILLPLVALGGVVLGGVLPLVGMGQLFFFSALLMGVEVLRRALLEPAFLMLFQSLPLPLRLHGYTATKSVYEPLGLLLGGGLLLLGLYSGATPWPLWAILGWMSVFLLLALVVLRRTYQHYLNELKSALGLPVTSTAPPAKPEVALSTSLHALLHLQRADLPTLVRHAERLLRHPHCQVRLRTLAAVGLKAGPTLLQQLALTDENANVREQASRLACRSAANPNLLQHADMAVRKGAIRGRLEAEPADADAQASLAALVADECCQLTALALVRFLEPAEQVACILAGLKSTDPALAKAATLAASAVAPAVLAAPLLELLQQQANRKTSANALVQLGDAVLPWLQEALNSSTQERYLREIAQVIARLCTAAGRQLLLELAQSANLCQRAAALRALNGLPAVAAESPLFLRLVEDEMSLAQHLVHSMVAANAELRAALQYEARKCQRRLLTLLLQLYDRTKLLTVQRSLLHADSEARPAALKLLDNLLPRPLYQGMQALLDTTRISEKIQAFDDLLGPIAQPEPIQTMIIRRGTAAFSAWTVGVALRQWHPTPETVGHLQPHLQSPHPLLRESAAEALQKLPLQRPAAYDQLLVLYPTLLTLTTMPDQSADSVVSFVERVRMLKNTTLFGHTPESVLGALVPVMHEVNFEQEQEIFAKGSRGTSLFIIYEGEVGIFNNWQLLITFGKGEFFGELSLLDAEPRSATAVALKPVRAFRIDQEDFYEVTEDCTEVSRSIMRELCQRIRRQNEKTAQPEPTPHST